MKIFEVIESKIQPPLIIEDQYGGFLKIQPDPFKNVQPDKFSLAYINETMANFYKVKPRILGLDSHGHLGSPDPHLHGFSKKKGHGYFSMKPEILDHSFAALVQTFYELRIALINRYKQDKQNAKNKRS